MNLVSKTEFNKLIEKVDTTIQSVTTNSDNIFSDDLHELMETQKKLKKAFNENRELLEKIKESNSKYKYYKSKLVTSLKTLKKQASKINIILLIVTIMDPMIEIIEFQTILI